jgi:LytR cell envelope-related transcriptional attenuator
VQGSTWTDPPLLSDPSQTVHIGSRTYSLFYEGEAIRAIAWHEGGAAYWIQNTLTNSVQPREMLAMAEQTLPVVTPRAGPSHVTPVIPTLHSVNLPPRRLSATTLTSKLAAGLSFVGLGVVALLMLLVLSRRRELGLLREQIAQAMTLEAHQRPLLGTASVAAGIPQPERAPTIYRARRRWRRGSLAVACTSVAAILAALAVHFRADLFPSSASPVPSIPVAVFNATSTPGAAHRIAQELQADRVHLGQIGNLNANLGTGVYVLYPPGAQAQARAIARLIPNLSPTVAPIQPRVQNAVGRHHEVVVIFG